VLHLGGPSQRRGVHDIPPLPSPSDEFLDRTGSVTGTSDPFSSRKLQGKDGMYRGKDVVPMWIADMDFRSPQPVVDAVVACAERAIYGYTNPPPSLTALTLSRLGTVYGCASPREEWLSWLPGLLPGLNHAVRATCDYGEGAVAVLTPAYPPFLQAPLNRGAQCAAVPLLAISSDVGGAAHHEIDWPALEATLSLGGTRLLLFCNPHNPSGRCWSREELRRVAQLCVDHSVTLCSDEVWGEMPLEPHAAPFTSALALLADDVDADLGDDASPAGSRGSAPDAVNGLSERLIVLTSPSKCFNVATLNVALAVIPNAELRLAVRRAGSDMAEVTPFGYFGAEAAYGHTESEAWRQRLVAYLLANREYACSVLGALPGVRTTRPQSSYLLWVDASEALPAGANAAELLLASGVGVSNGSDFGAPPGCFRVNFGCKRETLELGLGRIVNALRPEGGV